jgi:hypothetical protein
MTMASMWEMDDDVLMDELKAAVRDRQEVPPAFAEAAKAAYTWRRIDEELELLTLSYDSSVADRAAVRGPTTSLERILVFESEDVTMTLEVGPEVLMGQVVPARPKRVVLEVASGPGDEVEADDSGFFLLRRPPAGPIRLTWHDGDLGVVTDWVTI